MITFIRSRFVGKKSQYERSSNLKFISSHLEREDEASMTIQAIYDDGSKEKESLIALQDDEPYILYKYAVENDILKEWVERYACDARRNWFHNTTKYAADL